MPMRRTFARLFISSPFLFIRCEECARHEELARTHLSKEGATAHTQAICADCSGNPADRGATALHAKPTTLWKRRANSDINGAASRGSDAVHWARSDAFQQNWTI